MGHSLNRTSFKINQNLVIDDNTFNPGYILISDIYGNASWKNPSEYIDQTEPLDHFIGELYGGGIVVAVWREQRDTLYEICLIASVRNYSEYEWQNGSNFWWPWTSVVLENPLSIGGARYNTFGASNSSAIVAFNPTETGAAAKCLGYTNADLYGLGVYSDWYLPSTFEINCLANNSALVDRVISQYSVDKSINIVDTSDSYYDMAQMSLFENNNSQGYWTSTEFDAGSAYFLQNGAAGVRFNIASKSSYRYVRPFRQDIRRWNGTTWIQLEENNRRKTGNVLVTHNRSVGNVSLIVQNITALELPLGNTVIYATYSNLLSQDLSKYDHIWDIGMEAQTFTISGLTSVVLGSPTVTGISTNFTSVVTPGDTFKIGVNSYTVSSVTNNTLMTLSTNAIQTLSSATFSGFGGQIYTSNPGIINNNDKLYRIMGPQYTSYLQQGGAIFIVGEYGGAADIRNADIVRFISSVGGGAPVVSLNYATSPTLTIANEFLIANTTNTVSLAGTGRFTSLGSGTSITTDPGTGETGQAVVWKKGSLSSATKGTVVSVLDSNFLSGYFSQDFAANISQILNKK